MDTDRLTDCFLSIIRNRYLVNLILGNVQSGNIWNKRYRSLRMATDIITFGRFPLLKYRLQRDDPIDFLFEDIQDIFAQCRDTSLFTLLCRRYWDHVEAAGPFTLLLRCAAEQGNLCAVKFLLGLAYDTEDGATTLSPSLSHHHVLPTPSDLAKALDLAVQFGHMNVVMELHRRYTQLTGALVYTLTKLPNTTQAMLETLEFARRQSLQFDIDDEETLVDVLLWADRQLADHFLNKTHFNIKLLVALLRRMYAGDSALRGHDHRSRTKGSLQSHFNTIFYIMAHIEFDKFKPNDFQQAVNIVYSYDTITDISNNGGSSTEEDYFSAVKLIHRLLFHHPYNIGEQLQLAKHAWDHALPLYHAIRTGNVQLIHYVAESILTAKQDELRQHLLYQPLIDIDFRADVVEALMSARLINADSLYSMMFAVCKSGRPSTIKGFLANLRRHTKQFDHVSIFNQMARTGCIKEESIDAIRHLLEDIHKQQQQQQQPNIVSGDPFASPPTTSTPPQIIRRDVVTEALTCGSVELAKLLLVDMKLQVNTSDLISRLAKHGHLHCIRYVLSLFNSSDWSTLVSTPQLTNAVLFGNPAIIDLLIGCTSAKLELSSLAFFVGRSGRIDLYRKLCHSQLPAGVPSQLVNHNAMSGACYGGDHVFLDYLLNHTDYRLNTNFQNITDALYNAALRGHVHMLPPLFDLIGQLSTDSAEKLPHEIHKTVMTCVQNDRTNAVRTLVSEMIGEHRILVDNLTEYLRMALDYENMLLIKYFLELVRQYQVAISSSLLKLSYKGANANVLTLLEELNINISDTATVADVVQSQLL
ncbi:hypothetical protein SAMD00019534_102620 [Acytostelium subglobosum LB1]|uniref:hypothetical protein n=1 Tax=Acytostelium subglobosum LB1 TaxID=1410327 RepID=UPI00064486ED|nr:hypothetical protein SAMD00019534_102620 [Acytostelium subglobosum LB1]GAM27087.1 hypothetical protein SAMD00019534_102620 [Acytostelium subglobosum LB1]|eukprot:XP_012749967.1 hypothetical protein SAMD00019534_102620 [Acytostelium subglobosum LB1]